MSQYTIIYNAKRTRQLKFKEELKHFPSRNNSGQRKTLRWIELNEKEVIEVLENATPGSTKKATKYGMKIFQG